jgi:hypothetical protein
MADILDSTRKVLWGRSGNTCAFPGCGQRLELPANGGAEGSVVGHECHIVAKKDDPRIARSPSSLSAEESKRFGDLIRNRNGVGNLVLMCATHSMAIDAANQKYSVQAVVEMKTAHESKFEIVRKRELAGSPGDSEAALPGPLLVEDVPGWQRKAIKALANADKEGLAWLVSAIGEPPDAECIQRVVSARPDELVTGTPELLTAIARQAEAKGLWSAGADIWELRADRSAGQERADLYVRAAIDAGVGGAVEREAGLLERAREIDPSCPRLRLAELDDSLSPDEQIAYLEELSTDDAPLASLIASQRALAYLLLLDVESAEGAAAEAVALEADSVASRVVSINVGIQKGRLALIGDRPFLRSDVEGAMERALALREELLPMRRWEESARLLMLAADAPLLLRDPGRARALLELATEEELTFAPLGAEVLADAAIRANAPDLGLRFAEAAPARTDAIQRIRATALLDSNGPDRDEALSTLEGLAEGDGPEAEMAAAARLIACLSPTDAPWHDPSGRRLEGGPHDGFVKRMRVQVALKSDPAEAWRLAEDLPDEAWGAQIRLEVAGYRQDKGRLVGVADDFAWFGPDAHGELQIARALADGGEKARGAQTAFRVTRDLNAPARVRSDAHELRLKILADLGDWETARTGWTEWSEMNFGELNGDDDRVSAWQVRIAANTRG